VSAELVFSKEIAYLKRLIFRQRIYEAMLRSFLIVLCILPPAAIAEKSGYFLQGSRGLIYLTAILVSLFLGFLITHRNKRSFQGSLIDIDSRLALHDKISTAYEIQQLGIQTEFSNLLMEDAGRTLSRLTRKQIFPPRGFYLYVVLGVLVITNLAVYTGDYFGDDPARTEFDPEKSKEIVQSLRALTGVKVKAPSLSADSRPYDPYKKLDDMAQKIEDRSMTSNELLMSLSRMLEEIRSEQAKLVEALRTSLKHENIEAIDGQRLLQLDQLSSGDQKKMEETLKRLLSSRVPDLISQDIRSLSELQSLENLLSRIIDDIHQIEFDRAQRTGAGTPAGPDEAQDNDNRRAGEPELAESQDTTSISGDRENTAKMAGIDPALPGEYEQDMENGFGPHQGRSFLPGRAKSTGEEKAPGDINKTETPGIRDRTVPAKEEQYSVHIRALTAIGKSELKEENVIRPYQQEIESVLKKEDTPLNYREYIRNYFISIGLQTGKNDNGDS